VLRDDPLEEFQKKIQKKIQKKRFHEAEEIANHNMGAKKEYSSINFLGGFIESIS